MGRNNLDCAARVEAIERHAALIDGPIILVAHSGGVVPTVRWAQQTRRNVRGALLATPPDFERPLPIKPIGSASRPPLRLRPRRGLSREPARNA